MPVTIHTRILFLMDNNKIKIGITSTAVALACAGVTYAFLRYKYRLREASEALNYLVIRTVATEQVCDKVVQELRRRTKLHRAVGFDCEWVTEQGKRQPVALVQLSTCDGLCGLFRLNQLKTVPKSLKDLLEDESIYKVGVVPHDDGKYLKHDYGVELKSTLDIRHLAELCGYNAGGLASMSKALLQVTLDKSWRIRCSDWAADELTERQVNYAAADAHVAIKMFVDLVQDHYRKNSSWLSRRNSDAWLNMDDLCWKYVDVNFKTKQKPKVKAESMSNEGKRKEVLMKKYPSASKPTRSKPLYHNCFLQAPDGETLCTSDTKKALWYVEKELADIVTESPLTVRLRFEPSGRSVGDVGRYYTLEKENKCVVCGQDDSYIRKNVVPREYRKYFPEIMKEHSSHDVVLLCLACHQRSNLRDQAVRERLAAQCAAPLAHNAMYTKYTENPECKKIRSAARALLYQSRRHALPAARRRQLEDALLRHFPGHAAVTEGLLQQAADIQVLFENADYECHGQKVVDYYLSHGGLLQLERLWREHFLAAMRPKYMPQLWSVKHNEEKLRVKFDEGRLSEQDMKLIGLSRWL